VRSAEDALTRQIVRRIGSSCDVSHIVSAVLCMARNLNLQVVAEGVENPAELAFLRPHDCDEAQGYLFSSPVPAEAFARLLEARQIREYPLFWRKNIILYAAVAGYPQRRVM
jgi:EAL domain-containing protein (putative c-di-GMP-specific phosphodiesterase class I)